MTFISYAITVYTEHSELDRLLDVIVKNKQPGDEIVVQCDKGNTTKEVYDVLKKYYRETKVVEFPLNRNFAAYKNNLKKNCTGQWIIQIDADEYFSDYFIQNLHLILQANPETEVFLLGRINTVEGLTQDHINKWNWKVDDKGRINFPDLQTRILQNSPKINWASRVHEVLVGHRQFSAFPLDDEFCIIHHKTIEKQEHQNHFYDTL